MKPVKNRTAGKFVRKKKKKKLTETEKGRRRSAFRWKQELKGL